LPSLRATNTAYMVVLFFSLYCWRISSMFGATPRLASLVVFRHLRGRTMLTLVGRGARGSTRAHAEQVHDCRRRGACRSEDGSDIVGSAMGATAVAPSLVVLSFQARVGLLER
jgi:hypothetical protein